MAIETELRRAGFFPWGKNAWIHRNDEGSVMSTEDAVAMMRADVAAKAERAAYRLEMKAAGEMWAGCQARAYD